MKPEIVYAYIMGRTMRCEVIKKMKSKKLTGADQPLRVEVKKGVLSISIGVSTMAFCAMNGNYPFTDEDSNARWKVTNDGGFAMDVKHELEDEQEDGTTPVHLLLDKVIIAAIENGSQYVEENK